MDGVSKQGRVIPTNFGLKYNPPKLGIQYYFKENPKATFVHEVDLKNAENKDEEELINELFSKHKKFVDPKVVSRNQLENLMERLKSNLSRDAKAKEKSPVKMKENIHNRVEVEKENREIGKGSKHNNKIMNDFLNDENSSDNVINNKNSKNEIQAKSPAEGDAWNLEIDVPDSKEDDIMQPEGFEKDIFSRPNKEEMKNEEKEFMLDDFEMGHEDQKINSAHGMFDGLEDDDLTDKNHKHLVDSHGHHDGKFYYFLLHLCQFIFS